MRNAVTLVWGSLRLTPVNTCTGYTVCVCQKSSPTPHTCTCALIHVPSYMCPPTVKRACISPSPDSVHNDGERHIPYITIFPNSTINKLYAWAKFQLPNGMIQEQLRCGCQSIPLDPQVSLSVWLPYCCNILHLRNISHFLF